MSLKPSCNAHGLTSIPSQLEYHQTHGARCAKAARRESQEPSCESQVGRIGGMRRSAIRINRLRKAAAFHYHVVELLEGRAA